MSSAHRKNPSHYLIDTHTHFDDEVFDPDRTVLADTAYQVGVRHLVFIGYLAKYFNRMLDARQQLAQDKQAQKNQNQLRQANFNDTYQFPHTYLAFGLHPAYIAEHSIDDLDTLSDYLNHYPTIAVGEIGMDTYTKALKTSEAIGKQTQFFNTQLDLAVQHQLPVLLHIRKAHAETLAILKDHRYDAKALGGIAHSFSGGEQEAKAFVKLGFKLGVTGQYTNPNAKKLRRAIAAAVAEYGIECLVLETDCPDMTPINSQITGNKDTNLQSTHKNYDGSGAENSHTRNVPANLALVLDSLSDTLNVNKDKLAQQLWQNSCAALNVDWSYPSSALPTQDSK